jgi:DNA modification methylase
MKDILKIHSNENDLVLDMFAGSGTTGIACIEMNRDFILIEKDEVYFNVLKNRIEKYGKM